MFRLNLTGCGQSAGPNTALVALALLAGWTGLARAQDRAQIDPTVILGNRELPKVLYIVPWKKPVPAELAGRPMTSVVDEALAPVDRDVFRRQVQYQAQAKAYAVAQAARQAQQAQDSQPDAPTAAGGSPPATAAPPGTGAAPTTPPRSP